jgi:hypothetical protein
MTYAEELAELSLMLLVLRRIPGDVGRLTFEEVCECSVSVIFGNGSRFSAHLG